MSTSESERRITAGRTAFLGSFVGIVTTIVVSIAHELARYTDRVGTFEFERRAFSSCYDRAVRLIGSIRAVAFSITPLVLRDTCSVITLSMSAGAFAKSTLGLV